MKHYMYAMSGSSPSVIGGSTIREWFEYYKLDNGPDVFVPFAREDLPEEPVAGDILWFSFDYKLYGFATVLEVRQDFPNAKVEVVYDSTKVTMVDHAALTAEPGFKSGHAWFHMGEVRGTHGPAFLDHVRELSGG